MKGSVKDSMKETIPFFRTAWLALNPWRYDEARETGTGKFFKYFFSFVFLAFVLTVILMLPAIGGFVSGQMDSFKTLRVSVETEMQKPIMFPEQQPYITIDTREPEAELKEGKILITDQNIHMKGMGGKTTTKPLAPYKDLLANEVIVILALLLMLPSILFLFYIGYAVKLLALVLAAALTGFIIGRIAKFDLPFTDALKAGLLAATPMVIIDVIRMPFRLEVYYAQYIAFAIFFIAGAIKIGEFETGGRRRSGKKSLKPGKRSGKGGYVDLTGKA